MQVVVTADTIHGLRTSSGRNGERLWIERNPHDDFVVYLDRPHEQRDADRFPYVDVHGWEDAFGLDATERAHTDQELADQLCDIITDSFLDDFDPHVPPFWPNSEVTAVRWNNNWVECREIVTFNANDGGWQEVTRRDVTEFLTDVRYGQLHCPCDLHSDLRQWDSLVKDAR